MAAVDDAGVALASIWSQMREGTLTEAEAAPLIADAFRDALPAQLLQLSKTENVMGRITNTLFTLGPPDPTFGAPNAVAFDLVNGDFYGAKDATTGWPAPLPLFGEDGEDGAPGPDTETALNIAYALGHGTKYAFKTNADVAAFGLVYPESAVSYANSVSENNVKFEWVYNEGSETYVLTDTLPLFQARFIKDRGTVTGAGQTAKAVQQWNAIWDSGSPIDPPALDGLLVNIRTAESLIDEGLETERLGAHHNLGSHFFRAVDVTNPVTPVTRVSFNARDTLTMKNKDDTAQGGIKLIADGVMSAWAGEDILGGNEAEVFRYGWEDAAHIGTDPASSAIISGFGMNRFGIQSQVGAALVHISGSGLFEWEGYGGTSRLVWTFYEAGSNLGKTVTFENRGQSGVEADFIMSTATVRQDKGLHEFCSVNIATGVYTRHSQIDGKGQFGWGKAPEAAVDVGVGGMKHTPRSLAQVIAAFPVPTSGLFAFINDASAAHAGNSGNAVTGGGTFDAPIYYGEGAWRYV